MTRKITARIRLTRSATAYRRLAWKAANAGQTRQAELYDRKADTLMRQARRLP